MAPLLALLSTFVVFFALGRIGVPWFADVVFDLRLAVACMFALTASAHWGKRRPDLIRMVPPSLPKPAALVTLTGVLELLGAIGIALPATSPYAAVGLALLLVAMFPANVRAARERIAIAGKPATPLGLRTVLQLVFLAAALAAGFGHSFGA